MNGPNPAILFWMPIGIFLIVIAAGCVVYCVSKSSNRPSVPTNASEIGPKPKPPDDYYVWKDIDEAKGEWKKP